ncbi:hypothetical protein K438DRAFT_1800634 [Mycena galopus ATCC 62051]|nr:hypothetical protein K438DRAFT_1800634 [Mycena galopus ATCC 62051]
MVHVSITTPRSATFIFSWSALTTILVITSGMNLLPLSSTTVCIVYLHVRLFPSPLPFSYVLSAASQIQPASIVIFTCLTFNLWRSRSDVPVISNLMEPDSGLNLKTGTNWETELVVLADNLAHVGARKYSGTRYLFMEPDQILA